MMEAKTIAAFASNDPTRYHLNSVYRDADKFVATDGHRLIACNIGIVMPVKGRLPETAPNRCYEAPHFAKGLSVPLASVKYPNWRQLVPDYSQHQQFNVTVPNWFQYIKQGRKGNDAIGLSKDGDFTTAKGDSILLHFNPAFLREFAGLDLTLHVKDKLSPMVVTDKSKEWTALIMPMRG